MRVDSAAPAVILVIAIFFLPAGVF